MPNRKLTSPDHDVTRSFVIPYNQAQALRLLAERNHRTFSGELRHIIAMHLARHAYDDEKKAA